MCDVRLFRSAKMDYETAVTIWRSPYNDELILNNVAYHLQQAVEKVYDHSEMLGEWEAQTRYDMDFLVEKRKLDIAIDEVFVFLEINGITNEPREELRDFAVKEKYYPNTTSSAIMTVNPTAKQIVPYFAPSSDDISGSISSMTT